MTMSSPSKPARLTQDQRERLRLVQAAAPELDLDVFPDVLIIGPQRTGSTWLHENLARHPQIFMTEPKELYYWSSVQWPEYHPKHLPPFSADLSWYLDFFRESSDQMKTRHERSFADFGEPYVPVVRGESSATYAVACEPEIIREIVTLNPAIKAILLVRHPGERAWSHIKKEHHMDGGTPVDQISVEDCRAFIDNKYNRDCGLFSKIVAKWRVELPEDNLFVGDFRDVSRRPADLLRRVFSFLGVRDELKYVGDYATQQICETPAEPIPAAFQPLLDEIYRDEVELLADLGFWW
ncbi:MAG: sulfotransferase [Planctomycetota bacterium]